MVKKIFKNNNEEKFNNWHMEDWYLNLDNSGKICFNRKFDKDKFSNYATFDIDICMSILGGIDFITNIEHCNGVDVNRVDFKLVVYSMFVNKDSEFDKQNFLKFDEQRRLLENKGYINLSLVDCDFELSDNPVIRYDIGTLTPKGFEFFSFLRDSKIKKIKNCLFDYKDNLIWLIGVFSFIGAISSIVSLLLQVKGR